MQVGVIFPQTEIGADPVAVRDYVQTADASRGLQSAIAKARRHWQNPSLATTADRSAQVCVSAGARSRGSDVRKRWAARSAPHLLQNQTLRRSSRNAREVRRPEVLLCPFVILSNAGAADSRLVGPLCPVIRQDARGPPCLTVLGYALVN